MGQPSSKRGASIMKRPQNELGGDPSAPIQNSKARRILRLLQYQIHKDLLSRAFNRIGRAGSSAILLKGLALKTYEEQLRPNSHRRKSFQISSNLSKANQENF